MARKGVREKRGKKGESGGGAFCWAFGEPKGLCGARANGEALHCLWCAHKARTAKLLARGPMAIRWRAIGGDPSGRDAEGRASGDPRAAATRKMRVVPMKRQECRFPEGRAALLRGRRLEWCRWWNAVGRAGARPSRGGNAQVR